jgi:hypothetical protein
MKFNLFFLYNELKLKIVILKKNRFIFYFLHNHMTFEVTVHQFYLEFIN